MKLQIHHECKRLTVLHSYYVDHGQASNTAELYTEDAIVKVGSDEWRGKEHIRKWAQSREDNKNRITQHVGNNFLLTLIDEKEAEGTDYFTLYRSDGEAGRLVAELEGPVAVGEMRYRFINTKKGWRIASREGVLVFVNSSFLSDAK